MTTDSTIIQSLNLGAPAYDPKYLEDIGYPPRGTDIDILDVGKLCGFTLHLDSINDPLVPIDVVDLDKTTVLDWLQQARDERSFGKTPLRLLWCQQLFENDCLRSREDISISKSLIARCMNLQPIMIEKLGSEMPWSMHWPTRLALSGHLPCFGLSAGHLLATWSYDPASNTTYGFVVSRYSSFGRGKETFCRYLTEVKDQCQAPAYLPYAIASTEVLLLTKALMQHERQINDMKRRIARYLWGQKQIEIFEQASNQVTGLLYRQKFARVVIEMTRHEICSTPHAQSVVTPKSPTNDQSCRVVSMNETLLAALTLRAQELESFMQEIEYLIQLTNNHISTIMGMISFHQQTTAQEISEATLADGRTMKEIAEATRKDSTSMKVLALITMIFLPSTAISTIMAIPSMFDFTDNGRGGGPLVNSRFWIFFAVSIPLTIITIMFTWCWLKWENCGRPLPSCWPILRTLIPRPPAQKEMDVNKVV